MITVSEDQRIEVDQRLTLEQLEYKSGMAGPLAARYATNRIDGLGSQYYWECVLKATEKEKFIKLERAVIVD